MKLDVYHVAAFTDRQFAGNPAAVIPLHAAIDESVMQNIAAELNLSETAFVVLDGPEGDSIRWFTPKTEVALCGHATLASAAVIRAHLERADWPMTLNSASGPLIVDFEDEVCVLDFPANPAQPATAPAGLDAALGCNTSNCWRAADFYMIALESAAQVSGLAPDFSKLGQLVEYGVIVTAPGQGADFVSRFFAPGLGIDEDPVTGAAHCVLAPYWTARLDKTRMTARQVSPRGGEVDCEITGDRVRLRGRSVEFSAGVITIDE